ncbi:MAG: hypothetical protein IAI49_13365, partial [Candidatus Eremiobacteraeota bacterium]|nr:hypothetical protein [Candidatus Eremiobacteraeota bacterium]
DGDAARGHFARAIAGGTSSGAAGLVASARLSFAELAFASGDVPGALAAATEARAALQTAFGRGLAYADASANVAAYTVAEGDVDGARALAREALELARDLDFPHRAAAYIETLALVAILRASVDAAAFLFGFADAERARHAEPRSATERAGADRLLALLRDALPPAQLTERLARGAIAGLERAIAEALSV